MNRIFLFILLIITGTVASAQKCYTKNGNITFYSKASIENISADNNQVMSTLDVQSGQLQFSVLIKAFHFKKSLMEEHFNENYLESGKYPKATFKGNVQDPKPDLTKDGNYNVIVTGDMTIHGITKNVSTPGTITVKDGIVTGKSTFKVTLAEYKISIPKIMKDNIAEMVEVTVLCVYDKKM